MRKMVEKGGVGEGELAAERLVGLGVHGIGGMATTGRERGVWDFDRVK